MRRVKIGLDILLAGLLLCQMAYSLVGNRAHEWTGLAFIVLAVAHNVINRSAYVYAFRGPWSASRAVGLAVTALAMVSLVGLAASAPFVSGHVFVFLNLSGGASVARTVHLLCAYWGFVFFSFHLGLHFERLAGRMGLGPAGPFKAAAWALVILAAGFGVKAFLANDIASYLFLRVIFAYFDPDLPLWLFFSQYLSMMVTFAALAFCLRKLLRARKP